MKRPAFQFYPADWRKDVELRSCSIAARGLWIDIMCIAHECTPYGHLMVKGKPMSAGQLAGQVGLSEGRCAALLDELFNNGVARKAQDGSIYSKRMVEDEDLRNRRAAGGKDGAEHGAKGAEYGSKGGRPKTQRGDEKPPLHTPLEPPPSSSSSPSSSVPEGTVAGTPEPGDAPPAKKREPRPKRPAGEPAPTAATWAAYSSEYEKRYGVKPVSNAKNNGMLAQFLARIPAEEAPQVARHFVRSGNNLYVNSGHALNLLIRDAEKLRTEWVTGRVVSNIGTALTQDRTAQADRLMGVYAKAVRAADEAPARMQEVFDLEEPHARLE